MLDIYAALNSECCEECGEYANDELEHRLESFFVFLSLSWYFDY